MAKVVQHKSSLFLLNAVVKRVDPAQLLGDPRRSICDLFLPRLFMRKSCLQLLDEGLQRIGLFNLLLAVNKSLRKESLCLSLLINQAHFLSGGL